MTKKEQFLSIWVKKLPDSEQEIFIRQLEGLLEVPVLPKQPRRLSALQRFAQQWLERKHNALSCELASVKAVLEVEMSAVASMYSNVPLRVVRRIARLKGRKAFLETHTQQIRMKLRV